MKQVRTVVKQVRTVLGLLRDHLYVVNPAKCAWGQTEVEYLGHVVSYNGVQMDPCDEMAYP